MAEHRRRHALELGNEPGLAIGVEHDHTVVVEVVAGCAERLLREQERLEPDVRGAGDERERVRHGEHDQVVAIGTPPEEGSSVVDGR